MIYDLIYIYIYIYIYIVFLWFLVVWLSIGLDGLKTAISTVSVGVQGSGWGWLGFDKVNSKLVVTSTANQDPLQATTGLVPLLGIDVWEHAYYLQYKNVRPDYLKNIFSVINWSDVAKRLADAKK